MSEFDLAGEHVPASLEEAIRVKPDHAPAYAALAQEAVADGEWNIADSLMIKATLKRLEVAAGSEWPSEEQRDEALRNWNAYI